jgi:hypothetical protein
VDQASRDQIRFCALCPNVCRIMFPPGVLPKESSMCSALAYLAHGVLEGFVAPTPEVRAQLASVEGAEACRIACPYRIDLAQLLAEVRRECAAAGDAA